MKECSLIAILMIAVMMIVCCSHNAEVSRNADESQNVSFSASKTENHDSKIVTETESSTEISTTETTVSQSTTKPKKTEKTTTAKAKPQTTTTQRQTTTQKQTTTKRQTTTKKVTTTQKPTTHKVTTTKKPTTTKATPTKHAHTMPCGNVGKWYSSKDAFMSDYYAEADYWNNKLDNDEISYEEYISKVPRGYEVWQCSCGKWTGNYKYKQTNNF